MRPVSVVLSYPRLPLIPFLLLLIVTASMLGPSIANASHWLDPETLYEDGGISTAIDLAAGPGGEVHVVWFAYLDDYGAEEAIYHRCWRDGVWSEIAEVEHLNWVFTYLIPELSAVCDAQGDLHVVWTQHDDGPFGGRDYLYYSRFDGAAWSEPELISQTAWAGEPSLCLGQDRFVYLVALDPLSDSIRYRRLEDETWSDPTVVHESGYRLGTPQIAVGGDGEIDVVWYVRDDLGDQRLLAKHWDGIAWGDSLILGEGSTSYSPSIASGPEGVVHLAYHVTGSAPDVSIHYRKWENGGWSDAEPLTPGIDASNWTPSIAVGPAGEPHVVYSSVDFDLEEFRIYHVQREGSAWIEAEQVAAAEDECVDPTVGLDPDGRVHVAWLYPEDWWLGGPNVRYARRLIPSGIDDGTPLRPIVGVVGSPNPFRRQVRLRIDSAAPGPADVRIYDASGRLVRALLGGGPARTVIWDGKDQEGREVPPGVYLYRLATEKGTAPTGRLIRTR